MNKFLLHRPFISVSYKITSFFIVIIATVVTLFYLYNNSITYETIKKTNIQRMDEILTLAAPDIKTALEFENKEALDETMEKLLRLKNVLGIRIAAGKNVYYKHRGEGKVIACTDLDNTDAKLFHDPVPHFERHMSLGSDTNLCLIYSADPFMKQIRDYNRFAMIFALVLLTLTIPVGLIIKRFFRPLRELANRFREIDFDRFTTQVLPDSKNNDERKIIIESTREMFAKLEHYVELVHQNELELKSFNEKLAEEVEKKTKELKDLTVHLSERIEEQVEKIREQDHVLMRQARFAAMGEMLGNIAHQWRQPLNALAINIQDIGVSFQFNELNQEYLDGSIATSMALIQNMSKTIDDFRNFFDPKREKETFRIKENVLQTLAIMEASIREKKISVAVDIDEKITSHGFPNEFSQVLLNLINNAMDAFEKNGVKECRISFKAWQTEDKTVITVKDNGGGIDKTVMNKIFDPYFTTKFKSAGTGVGLYMAKMIIEQHMNGSITAANTEEGACFTIILC